MARLTGLQVRLRPVTSDDVDALVAIRETPEVYGRWGGGGGYEDEDRAKALRAELLDDIAEPDLHVLAIEHDGRVVGAIQWHEEEEAHYRHAGIDLFIDPVVHGRGLGTDAVRTLARHLIDERGHHRLVIDPAADNHAAIRCYSKVGFRPVGVMRQYERGPDGKWHDGLLMDLLAADLDR